MSCSRSLGPVVAVVALAASLGGVRLEAGGTQCPVQEIRNLEARCAQEYGALVTFCYAPAPLWWFKESVVGGGDDVCQPGGIDQTTNPFQSRSSCIGDEVLDLNGPPGDVAPCDDTTFQKVFTGPTQLQVNDCQYANTQLIEVTDAQGDPPSAVKTTITPTAPLGAAASVACRY